MYMYCMERINDRIQQKQVSHLRQILVAWHNKLHFSLSRNHYYCIIKRQSAFLECCIVPAVLYDGGLIFACSPAFWMRPSKFGPNAEDNLRNDEKYVNIIFSFSLISCCCCCCLLFPVYHQNCSWKICNQPIDLSIQVLRGWWLKLSYACIMPAYDGWKT